MIARNLDIEAVAGIIEDVARDVIMPRWRNLAAHEVGVKSKAGDLVTIADREAEQALSRRLGALLPGANVVGEEAVAADPRLLEMLRREELVWVIDPIDGTRKFAEGKPTFDVLVALVHRGRGVAGWIYAPAEGSLYMGERGAGVVHRDASGEVNAVRRRVPLPLKQLEGILGPRAFVSRGFASPEPARFRSFSGPVCAGHNYARLLRGDSDFLVNFSTLPWDHLAGLALTEEAGFHAARHDGSRYDPMDSTGGILVAPDLDSWQEILAALMRPA